VYSGLRLKEPYRLSPFTDRVWHPAPGLEGGVAGAPGLFELEDGTQLHPKRTVTLEPDQKLVIGLPGGGGLGDPKTRDPEMVRRDVSEGLVSTEQAREAYGVALTGEGEVDEAETRRLRRS
jgi:N-methylhydantoinase B